MTETGTTSPGPGGVLRMTWVRDQLAHVLDHSQTDETSGTWTGLACPSSGLAVGADVDNAMLRRLAGQGEIADLVWQAPDDITARHGQLYQAAIQAHQAGATELAGQSGSRSRQSGHTPGRQTTPPSSSCKTPASLASQLSNPSAGSSPPSNTTPARTA